MTRRVPRELEPVWPGAPRVGPPDPLPRYRFQGALHPHPRRHPQGSLFGQPDPAPGLPPERWREDATWLRGIDLYHGGYLWEAHEQWEACYFASKEYRHRRFVQALIQLAAALIKAHQGNAAGTRLLAESVVERLRAAVEFVPPGERYAGLDPHALLADVERHFAPALGGVDSAETVGLPPHLELRRAERE